MTRTEWNTFYLRVNGISQDQVRDHLQIYSFQERRKRQLRRLYQIGLSVLVLLTLWLYWKGM